MYNLVVRIFAFFSGLSLQLAAAGRRVLPKVDCVLAETDLECIQKVGNGQADLVNLSPKGNTSLVFQLFRYIFKRH